MRVFGLWIALVAAVTITTTASAQNTFNVSNFGLTAFTINGQNNPTITVTRGQTYTFDIFASGHPFYIKTARVIGTGSQYNVGVTGNGAEEGELTWTVPLNAPGLFYQCGVHSPMGGTISVQSPPSAPGIDPRAFVVLGLGLVALGFVVIRKRGRTASA